MIRYSMFGTSNIERVNNFYDEIVTLPSARSPMDNSLSFFLYDSGEEALFALTKPYDGQRACNGNVTMTALNAPSRAAVRFTLASWQWVGRTRVARVPERQIRTDFATIIFAIQTATRFVSFTSVP